MGCSDSYHTDSFILRGYTAVLYHIFILRFYTVSLSHLYTAILFHVPISRFFFVPYIFNPYYLITDMGVCKVFFPPLRLPAPVHSGPLVPKRLAAQLFPLVFISTCYIIFYKTFVKKPLK